MTRKQEIIQAVLTQEGVNTDKEMKCFVLGAEWADSHPLNQWHKVEDELPPRRSEYSFLSIEVWATDGVGIFKTYYSYFNECWDKYYVTHWMPLPDLPKKED